MLVPDFLQANDWKMGRFLAFVLTLQAIVLLLILLDSWGMVPLSLRQIAAFLFYSYIPGLVLLRALGVHRLGGVLTTLLSVGASVVLMMFVGFALDLLYLELTGPLPFTLPMVLLGQTLVLMMLCGLAYLTDRRYADEPMLNVSPLISAPAFVLYSLPLIAVLSTYLLNGWNDPILQVALLLLIPAVLLTILVIRLPPQLYPVSVVCISLAVLFHTSLMSRFVVEWADVTFEYWSANSTLIEGYWDPMGSGRTDTVLSVTVLAPMLSLLGGMGLDQVFKVAYPALLSLVPLGAFLVTRHHLGERPALLAAFLIISGTVFYTEMLGLARQTVAELLLVGIMAILTYRTTVRVNKILIAWVLALGLIVSHYGVLAIIGPCIIVSMALYLMLERKTLVRRTAVQIAGSAALLTVPSVLWYGVLSNSIVLNGIVRTFYQILDGLGNTFGLMNGVLGAVLLQQDVTELEWLKAFLTVLIIGLSALGLFYVVRRGRSRVRWDSGYLVLTIPLLVLSFLTLFDSGLFTFVSRDRLFHLCLLLMAPLAVYGGLCALRKLDRPSIAAAGHRASRASVTAIAAVLVLGFLLNTGVVSLALDEPLPIELDMDIKDVPRHSDGAFLGASFTVDNRGGTSFIFSDANRAYLLEMLGGAYKPFYGRNAVPIYGGNNVHYFLGSENLAQMVWLEDSDGLRLNKTYIMMDDKFSQALLRMDKVYASQEAELYYKKF